MTKELDGEEWIWQTAFFSDPCTLCANLIDNTKRTCKAFPKGIPREIWLGKNDHTKPYRGDGGILYQKIPQPVTEQLQRKEKPVPPTPDKPPDVDAEIDGYEAGLIKAVDKFESDTIAALQTCYTNKKQMNRKIAPPAPIDTSQFTALLLKIAQTTVEAAQNIIHSFAERGYLQGIRFAGGQLEPMRMQFAFNMPYDKAVIQVLKDRNAAAFKGVTDDMAKEIMRQVTEGALKGQSVNTIAGNIRSVCSDIGKQRSILIARTELMKAVNEGVLRRFEDSGVEQVLRLETADERTCTDHKFVIDGNTYYGCQPEEDGGIGGKILTMDQAWQVQAQQHPKCRGSFAPKFKGLELSMKNNDDEAGHWVTNDDGNHIFITDRGELKTSPGGQVIGYAKDTDTWQVQNQAKKGMHMPQSSYTKAATPRNEPPKIEPTQLASPNPATPVEWSPGSHESLKDAPEPVKKQIAPGEIYDGKQYRLTVNDKKKVSVSRENIEQRKEDAKAEAGKLIDAKKEKLGKKYGLTKRDAMAQAVLSVQRSSEDYRLGIGQGKLDRLTGNDYQNWRATPEYNMGYHEGFLEKLPAIIDQASFNPNLYAAQQIRNQKGGG